MVSPPFRVMHQGILILYFLKLKSINYFLSAAIAREGVINAGFHWKLIESRWLSIEEMKTSLYHIEIWTLIIITYERHEILENIYSDHRILQEWGNSTRFFILRLFSLEIHCPVYDFKTWVWKHENAKIYFILLRNAIPSLRGRKAPMIRVRLLLIANFVYM